MVGKGARGANGGILYKVDIYDDATILNAFNKEPIGSEKDWGQVFLPRAQKLAEDAKMPELAKAIEEFSKREEAGNRPSFGNFQFLLEKHFPRDTWSEPDPNKPADADHRKVNAFMRSIGIDGVSMYQDLRIINYNAIKEFSVEKLINGGPPGVPERIRAEGRGRLFRREGETLSENKQNLLALDVADTFSLGGKVLSSDDGSCFVSSKKIASSDLERAGIDLENACANLPQTERDQIKRMFQYIVAELHLGSNVCENNNGGFNARRKFGLAVGRAARGAWEPGQGIDLKNLGQTFSYTGLEENDPNLFRRMDVFFKKLDDNLNNKPAPSNESEASGPSRSTPGSRTPRPSGLSGGSCHL